MPLTRFIPASDRLVITGVGVISAIGSGLSTARAMLDVECADGNGVTQPIEFSGHIDDFGPLDSKTKKTIRKSLKLMNRETRIGVAATNHAIVDARLNEADYDSDRIGVCFGAGNVEINPEDFVSGVEACAESARDSIESVWGSVGTSQVDPLWILRILPNMPACHIAIGYDFRGPNNTITQAEASANLAIAEALHNFLDDEVDAMIVGATGTCIRATPTAEFDDQDAIPASEGAAAFVIERLESALSRGATIYGEVLATSSSCVVDGTNNPRPAEAVAGAIDKTLRTIDADNSKRFVACNNGAAIAPIAEALTSIEHLHPFDISQRIGRTDAGSGAIGLAVALAALGDETTTAINVSLTNTGLASCLAVGKTSDLRAA